VNGYMVDTNIISHIIRNPDGPVARQIEHIGPKEIFTSIVVASELRYGCAKKGSAKLTARVEGILETIPVLPLDVRADAKYAKFRTKLEADGQPIGMNDLLIAAHAHSLDLTLVTDNTREFSRVDGLKIENWLER